ncbi:tRNA methyltransferase 10 homolog B isoform X2 [Brachyistius frenatus]|uniref:tRNA methyltransferase 10 homolog B isoform X2 n=1 Tax=Brachyistius frenatus TaxID=100188 RepID=UPI0037E919ED
MEDEGQLNGVSEVMDLLHINVETDDGDVRAGRDDESYSRNVLRKQQHWEKRLAAKKSKRKEEKQRRKEEKQRRKLHRGSTDRPQFTKRVLKAITRERLAEARSIGNKLCVDLSMTDRMSDKPACVSGDQPTGRSAEAAVRVQQEGDAPISPVPHGPDGGRPSPQRMEITEESCLDLFPPETVVYLTPDAEEALETVDADKVYVLGGLVDESIQKKLSLSRARELSVRTARLPVDEYMVKRNNVKNFHSKILAVNQVFDILVTFCDTGSWTEALRTWFPPGKGYVVAPGDLPALPATRTRREV